MSTASNNNGRAFEYACLITLFEQINEFRQCEMIRDSAFKATYKAWFSLSPEDKNIYELSARIAGKQILELEPRILENDGDILTLLIQKDQRGKEGDVRDLLIIRKSIQWEIGLSLKHNHFAVKHSRLSPKIDFGKKWFGSPCSENYWEKINPIFDFLRKEQKKNIKFSELKNKEEDIYVPVLKAFMNEVKHQAEIDQLVPQKMVEYLLGTKDFYKIISLDKQETTQIQTFNLHGDLNLPSKTLRSVIEVPLVMLPSRIVSIDFDPQHTNTIEIYLDKGWQFSFRIHNAEKYVTPSLKFDIQIIGMPAAILTINCLWR